jgi:hypothetical protein
MAVSDVDLSNRTCTVATALGGSLSIFSTTGTLNFDTVPFWGMKPSDLDLMRLGKLPQNPGERATTVRPNITVSVPAGTFISEELVGPDGTAWFDARSGVCIRAIGPMCGFLGDLGGLYGGNTVIELTSTNIPMSRVASPSLFYGAAIGIAVIALGIITYIFTRGGRGRVEQETARREPVHGARAWVAPSPAEAAGPPTAGAGGSSPPAVISDALDKLAKLKSLLLAGLISAQEFQEQKAKLLGQLR